MQLEEENAALKEYRTAEARRRAELYAAKVDANWCLKNEIEAVRKELAEARREIDRLRKALEKIIDPMTDALSFIKHTAKAALAGKEK